MSLVGYGSNLGYEFLWKDLRDHPSHYNIAHIPKDNAVIGMNDLLLRATTKLSFKLINFL